jgi:hypothetical protein
MRKDYGIAQQFNDAKVHSAISSVRKHPTSAKLAD